MLFWVPWDTLLRRLVAWWQRRGIRRRSAVISASLGKLT